MIKFIRKISEDEMILEFLKSEINSKRFKSKLLKSFKKFKVSKKIINQPDLTSKKENILRKRIIGVFRGYGKNKELFKNFPKNVNWFWVEIPKKELEKVKYINYSYWNLLSNNTRLPKVAVKNINNGIKVFGVSNEQFLQASKKTDKFPPLILVSSGKDSPLVVLEGHLRLTSYFLSPKSIPLKLKIILGLSKDFNRWLEY